MDFKQYGISVTNENINQGIEHEKKWKVVHEIGRNLQMVILICNHKFHGKCIVERLKRDENCPNCRTNCRKKWSMLNSKFHEISNAWWNKFRICCIYYICSIFYFVYFYVDYFCAIFFFMCFTWIVSSNFIINNLCFLSNPFSEI